jgi:predicted RND superfamily exporter protein
MILFKERLFWEGYRLLQSKLRGIASGILNLFKKAVDKAVSFSLAFPWIILIFFAALTIFFGAKTTSLKFETDIDNLATKSASEIKEIELAARDFSIWEPLYLVLVGDTRTLETWQRIALTTANLRKVENVARALSPLDSTYMTLQGFSVKSLPVTSATPSNEEELKVFRNNLSMSFDSRFSVSPSEDAVVVRLYIRGGLGSRGKKAIDEIQKILQDEWGEGGYYLTGELFLGYSVDKTVVADVITLFPLAIAIVFLVTILSFRSIAGVMAPTITVLSTVVVTLGFMATLGKPLTIISAVLPVLLIAMSSADSIHIFSRYREEISRGSQKRQAITQSINSLVLPVVMTSLTTAAGFGSLVFSSIIPMKELGYFSVFGIIYAMLFSLLAVPALLSLLPAPRVDIASSRSVEEPFMDKLLYRFSMAVAEKRRIVLLISIAVALVCVVGITNVQFESNLSRYFRKGSAVSMGVINFEERFGGSSLLIIAVDSGKEGGVMTVNFMKALGEMEKVLNSFDILSRTSSFYSLVGSIYPGELNQGQITLIKSGIGSSGVQGYVSKDSSKAAIHTYIRNTSTREISRTLVRVEKELRKFLPAGATLTLTGTPRVIQLHMESFSQSQAVSLLFSAIIVWLIVSLMFLSIFIGSLAMLPLLFTIVFSLGIMGLTGIPLDAATVLVASISVGVGIDYSIHFIERVKSELKLGNSLERASNKASRTAGRAILINAVTLIAGFSILAFSNFLTVSAFGILMTFTMATSSVAALVIIPAILNSRRLGDKILKALLRTDAKEKGSKIPF